MLLPDTIIYTKKNPTRIEDIKVGDETLSCDGWWSKVITCAPRNYQGKLIELRATGINSAIYLHPSQTILCVPRGLETRSSKFRRRCELYKMALDLHKDGMGSRRISKIINFNEHTISSWIYYGCKPEGKSANRSLREDVLLNYPRLIPASEIEKGDAVVFPILKESNIPQMIEIKNERPTTPRTIAIPTSLSVSDDVLRFFGYYISEGYASYDGSIAFCFNKNEKEYIEDVCVLAKTIFGLKAYAKPHKEKESTTVWMHSVILSRFLNKNFGHLAENKTLPEWITCSPGDKIIPVLKGMLRGDGSLFMANSCASLRESYSTVSLQLAYQLFLVLVKLEMMPKINYNEKRKFSINTNGKDSFKILNTILKEDVKFVQKRFCSRTYIDKNYYYMPLFSKKMIDYKGKMYKLKTEVGNYTSNLCLSE